ncbi:response regulator [Roseibium algae]|uniref:Response regulator n=1 Tax=Roseibium algae TaxID=3123038 RepID=A0ABU8TGQ2_9HYPH
MRIHIIEDDPAVSDALAIVLSGLGHDTQCYFDAETFLSQPIPGTDDVVIVDLGLPGIGGEEVAKMLSGQSEPPRVIVISGRSQALLQRSLPDIASLTVLRKPLSLSTLTEHLN